MGQCLRLLVCITAFCSVAWGQDRDPFPYRLDSFTTRNGMRSNHVTAVFEEKYGLLWVGTENGLCSFDGMRFEDIDFESGQNRERIVALAAHPQGLLCLSTTQVLLRRQQRFESLLKEKSANFNLLYVDGAQRIWVGSRGMLFRADSDLDFKAVALKGLPFKSSINAIEALGKGRYLASVLHKGLFIYDEGQESWTSLYGQIPNLDINALLPEDSGSVLIACHGGVLRFDHDQIVRNPLGDTFSEAIVRVLVRQGNGDLWLGGPHLGAVRFDGAKLQRFSTADGLPSPSIYGIFPDQDGKIWFRSNNGVGVYSEGKIQSIGTDQGLPSLFIEVIHPGPNELIWIGTVKGLARIQPKRLETLFKPASSLVMNPAFQSIYKQDEDRLWMPSQSGLAHVDHGMLKIFTTEDGLPSNLANQIVCDRGRVWVGTEKGPAYLDKERFYRPHYAGADWGTLKIKVDAKQHVWVLDMNQQLWRNNNPADPAGGFEAILPDEQFFNLAVAETSIWLHSAKGFLQLADAPGPWIEVPSDLKIYSETFVSRYQSFFLGASDGVYQVTARGLIKLPIPLGPEEKPLRILEANNYLFVVTSPQPGQLGRRFRAEQLWVREQDTWKTLKIEDPDLISVTQLGEVTWLLTSTELYQYQAGNLRRFSHNQGLAGSNPSKIIEGEGDQIWVSADGGITKFQDGLSAILPTGQDADETITDLCHDRQGNLWIRAGGVIQRYREMSRGPSVHLDACFQDDTSLPLDRPIVLPSTKSNLSFRYRAINLRGGDAVQFTWQIMGSKRSYQGETSEQVLTLPSLPPDIYRLSLRAFNSDLAGSEQALTLDFQILAPFWQRGLMPLFLILLVLMAAYLIYRLRLRHKLEQARVINELAVAHNLQQALMPTQAPRISGYDIAGICAPAQEVGGDYFDYFWTDEQEQRLAITIMDVSGKSMQGAIISVLSSGLLYGNTEKELGPAAIFSAVNRQLFQKTDKRTFITGLLAVLDHEKAQIAMANAGHQDPILLRDGKALVLPRTGHRDMALGAVKKWDYGETSLQLEPGDVLCLYTDGLSEAQNCKNALFGEQALISLLERHHGLPAASLLQLILDEIAVFRAKAQQSDDITIVLLKYLGQERERSGW